MELNNFTTTCNFHSGCAIVSPQILIVITDGTMGELHAIAQKTYANPSSEISSFCSVNFHHFKIEASATQTSSCLMFV